MAAKTIRGIRLTTWTSDPSVLKLWQACSMCFLLCCNRNYSTLSGVFWWELNLNLVKPLGQNYPIEFSLVMKMFLCCPEQQPLATCGFWVLGMWLVRPGEWIFTFHLILSNLNLATCASGCSIRQHSSRSMTSLQVIQGIEDSVKGTPWKCNQPNTECGKLIFISTNILYEKQWGED